MLSILCDFDGVLCSLDTIDALACLRDATAALRIAPERLLADYFFSNPHFREIDEGRMTYDEMLSRIMPECWLANAASWSALWDSIWSCYKTDHLLLAALTTIVERGMKVRIVTDNHISFQAWFSTRREFLLFHQHVICSAELGSCKPSPAFFDAALASVGCAPAEVCFIDNNRRNTAAAALLGMQAILHVDGRQTVALLSKIHGLDFLEGIPCESL